MAIDSELILGWKRQYGDVYSVAIRNKEYVFRALSYGEYDEALLLSKYVNTAQQEDYIVTVALLHPQNISVDDMSPGLVTQLAEAVLDNSGFHSPHRAMEILAIQRERAHSVRTTVYALVLDAMSAYKKEDLDKLNFAQVCQLSILAEEIIRIRQAYAMPDAQVTFEIVDVEAKRREDEEKAKRRADGLRRSAELMGHDPSDPRYQPTVKPDDPIARKLKAALGG